MAPVVTPVSVATAARALPAMPRMLTAAPVGVAVTRAPRALRGRAISPVRREQKLPAAETVVAVVTDSTPRRQVPTAAEGVPVVTAATSATAVLGVRAAAVRQVSPETTHPRPVLAVPTAVLAVTAVPVALAALAARSAEMVEQVALEARAGPVEMAAMALTAKRALTLLPAAALMERTVALAVRGALAVLVAPAVQGGREARPYTGRGGLTVPVASGALAAMPVMPEMAAPVATVPVEAQMRSPGREATEAKAVTVAHRAVVDKAEPPPMVPSQIAARLVLREPVAMVAMVATVATANLWESLRKPAVMAVRVAMPVYSGMVGMEAMEELAAMVATVSRHSRPAVGAATVDTAVWAMGTAIPLAPEGTAEPVVTQAVIRRAPTSSILAARAATAVWVATASTGQSVTAVEMAELAARASTAAVADTAAMAATAATGLVVPAATAAPLSAETGLTVVAAEVAVAAPATQAESAVPEATGELAGPVASAVWAAQAAWAGPAALAE